MVPLRYVFNSGSFPWAFSQFMYFRSMSGLSQVANFHFRGPSGRFARSDVIQISTHVLVTFTEQVVPIHKHIIVPYSEFPRYQEQKQSQ